MSITGNAVVTINPGAGTATLPPILAAMIAYDLQVSGNGVLTINPDDPPAGPDDKAGSVRPTSTAAALDALMGGGSLSGSGTTDRSDGHRPGGH